MKKCSKCFLNKSYTDFNKDNSNSSGYRSECRKCQHNMKRKNTISNSNRDGNNILCSHCLQKMNFIFFKKDIYYIGGYGKICKKCSYSKYGNKSNYNNRDKKIYKKGYVYILESNGVYKIGLTIRSIKTRIIEFQTGNPYKINYIKQYKSDYINYEEYFLHTKFQNKNFRGEWFLLNASDLIEIDNYFNY